MPVTRFWLLSRTIDRIAAEEMIRSVQVAASVQSAEGFKDLMTQLNAQMGVVVEIDQKKKIMSEKLDRAGLAALKAMKPVGSVV